MCDNKSENIKEIGTMIFDKSISMKLIDYEGGYFIPIPHYYDSKMDQDVYHFRDHLSLMHKSQLSGLSTILSTGEIFHGLHRLICPVMFNNIT